MIHAMKTKHYDLIVIGAGAAGIMASIIAARTGKNVLLLEKLSQIAAKLKATGGGRCNLTNTLDNNEFMTCFGRDGRFMRDALKSFDHNALVKFFDSLGVETHAPDGYRIFPKSHSSLTIIEALKNEMETLGVALLTSQKVVSILYKTQQVTGVKTTTDSFFAPNVIISTGGLGYSVLGAEGDGYAMARELGHKVTSLHPAMMPLHTKENWIACRADTISKVELRVGLAKYKKLRAYGDLIFTKSGIRGPVVLDFARHVTPLLETYGEVPILLNLTKGMNEEQIRQHFKEAIYTNQNPNTLSLIKTLLPEALSLEICKLAGVNPELGFNKQSGQSRDKLIRILTWTPLTVTGHEGFKKAMITRGGISLKEINPKTMQSRLKQGLYFCGEVMDIDGPCGGYNLQWSFSSGALAGKLLQ